jgi:hypothetical protein
MRVARRAGKKHAVSATVIMITNANPKASGVARTNLVKEIAH